MAKITIDEKACQKHNMTMEEFLVAYMIYRVENPKQVSKGLLDKEVLVKIDGRYMVTQRWADEMDEILCDANLKAADDTRFKNLAKKMQAIFPPGKSFGTPYYYRCNGPEVVKKLKKFVTLFGNYKDEEFLQATQKYVDSFHGNYQKLRLIKYFILKDALRATEDGERKVEQISDLLTFLENKDGDNEASGGNHSDDWMMDVMN